jgi:hypothetical protein
MIVLSEATSETALTASARDNFAMSEAAKLAGCTVYYIPKDFSRCENAENGLWHIPPQAHWRLALWIGFIPTAERYEAIYTELLRKQIRLLNSPQEHLIAQEFDRAYPMLQGITPRSVVLTSADETQQALEILGLPVFVKGAVRSRKEAGIQACVATTKLELRILVQQFLDVAYRSRGRAIVRELVALKHHRTSAEGFPLGREYRVFLYRQEVLGFSYYWEGEDRYKELSTAEEHEVLQLAKEASRRLGVPFLAIDVGQTEDGQWIIIEANDAQFAGTSQIPLLPLWNAIQRINESAGDYPQV